MGLKMLFKVAPFRRLLTFSGFDLFVKPAIVRAFVVHFGIYP